MILRESECKVRLSLGIDIGSTTAKIVLMQGDEILYEAYERHFSQVRQKTIEMIQKIKAELDGCTFTAAVSGSAGLGMAQAAGIPFVQEVFATGEVVSHLEPDTSAVRTTAAQIHDIGNSFL